MTIQVHSRSKKKSQGLVVLALGNNIFAAMDHILYAHLHAMLNDPLLENILEPLLDHKGFEWVCVYLFSDTGSLVVQHIPRSQKHKSGSVQAYGGDDSCERNLFFMFNKIRLELMDESSLGLVPDVPYVASPIYLVGSGLVQAIMVQQQWLAQQRLWSPERARNHHGAVPHVFDISQFWDTLNHDDRFAEEFCNTPKYQIVKEIPLKEAVSATRHPWRTADYKTFKLLLPIMEEMLDRGMSYRDESLKLKVLGCPSLTPKLQAFTALYTKACRVKTFRDFMHCMFCPWLPLLKYEALVMSEHLFLVHTFTGRSLDASASLRQERVADLQGGLVAVWRGTMHKADKSLVEQSVRSSDWAMKHLGLCLSNIGSWFEDRGLNRFFRGRPNLVPAGQLGGGMCANDGTWVRCPYFHPAQVTVGEDWLS